MTIEQTVDIPVDRRLILDIPQEVPAGRAQVIIKFPINDDAQTGKAVLNDRISNEAFRNAIRRAYGAWKKNPWTNHLEDVNNWQYPN